MTSGLRALRLILHVSATLLLTLSIAFALSSILTTGWQTYFDSASQEIHQHGLWFDYTFTKRHFAGKTEPDWHWKYKFGQSVDGDEPHRWKPYQYNSLILITAGAFLGFVSAIVSYMAPFFVSMAAVWVFITIWPAFLSLAAVIMFFTSASLPDNNHVFIDRRHELEISYSFYYSVVATVGFGFSLAIVIGAAVVDIMLLRRGERFSFRDSYFKVSTKATTTTTTTGGTLQKQNQSTSV